jgi:hypothetical protein
MRSTIRVLTVLAAIAVSCASASALEMTIMVTSPLSAEELGDFCGGDRMEARDRTMLTQ